MKWSLSLMIFGILVIILGLVPPYFDGVTFNTLEVAASFFAVGILLFLVGLLIRRAKKVFESTFADAES